MTDRPTVLVVEDERDLADLYETWLQDDYTVRVSYTGEDALSKVDETVSVALIDRRLPERDGDDVVADIQDRYPDVRVALVTGVEPDFDIIDLGFDAYVVKPVSRDELRDVVARLLTRLVYSEEVREYFSLASKRATLETEKSAAELAENEAYQDLVERLLEHRDELDGLLSQLDTEEFIAVFRELNDEVDE